MLEVNPGSETKLSGFTAVSGFRGVANGNVKTENVERLAVSGERKGVLPSFIFTQRRTGEFSSRRTGECSPQRVQNDIQSFL